MDKRFVPLLSLLLPALLAGPGSPQAGTAEPGSSGADRLVQPGPRWTGRWIVHVARDGAEHREAMAAIGALRRAKDATGLADFIASYEERMALGRAPVAAVIAAHGGTVVGTNWLVNTIGIEDAGQALLDALLALPEVQLIQPDQWAHAQMQIATDALHHNSDAANQLTSPGGGLLDGHGVTVALLDSGIDANHAGSGRPHAAFFPNGNPATPTGGGIGGSRILSAVGLVSPPEDIHGHGTRMASVVAGAEWNALPDVDDAPAFAAKIRSYKISDDSFGALASYVTMDLAFAQILSAPDVVVANMSYDGTPSPVGSPNQAIEDATLADVFVTLSAGNTGADLSFAHGSYNAVVAGASFVTSKQPYVFPGFLTSAIGPLSSGRKYPHVIAVGDALTCAGMDNEAGSIDSYGTSGAAALVAGTAALVRQAAPGLSALQVKALILNTSEAVSLGNPAAAGYGYLRSDRAAQAALAGQVVQGIVSTGQVKSHALALTAGDEVAVTLAWNREGSSELTIDDLDLRVRDPLGVIVDWSASIVDNVEQIRFTASVDGTYKVQVIPIFFDGDGKATYALAGVTTPSSDPGSCTPGVMQLLEQSPAAIPALVQGFDPLYYEDANDVTLIGCGFTGVTALTLQGVAITKFTVVDDNILTFNMPIPPAVGTAVPFQIKGPAGTLNTTLVIAPADNVLNMNGNVVSGYLELWVGGQPGDFFGLAFSPDLVPTVVPGFFAVEIGKGGQTLFPFAFGQFNALNGVQTYAFHNVGGVAGQYFYAQGVVLDGATLAPPWDSTNPATTIWTH